MWRKWAWLGVALFVALDVVLVAWAVDHTRSAPPAYSPSTSAGDLAAGVSGGSGPGETAVIDSHSAGADPTSRQQASAPQASATDSSDSKTATSHTPASHAAVSKTAASHTPAPNTPPLSGPDAVAQRLANTVLMDMANDGSVIRAVRGSCGPASETAEADDDSPLPAPVAVSHDFGETWEEVPPEVTELAHAVVRVAARGSSRSWFVTADEGCELIEHDAAAGAADWSTSSPEGAWALPTDALAMQLVAPGGVVDIDCTPRYIAAIDAKHAVVACTDGQLLATADSGVSWDGVAGVPGVVAISFVGTNTGYALAATDECAAQVLTTSDGAGAWEEAACLDGDEAQAITAAGTTVLALVDGDVQRSDDKGATW